VAAVLPIMQSKSWPHHQHRFCRGLQSLRAGRTVYSATKFAVRALTEGLRMELKADNIRCTVISPAAVATELPEGSSEETTRKNLREFYKIAIPPESIARAIAYAIEQPADVEIGEAVIRPLLWTSSTETNYAAFTARHVVQILGAFRHDLCRRNAMKVLFISFVVGWV